LFSDSIGQRAGRANRFPSNRRESLRLIYAISLLLPEKRNAVQLAPPVHGEQA